MLAQELVDLVLDKFHGDSSNDPAIILKWLNIAQVRFITQTGYQMKKSSVALTAGTQEYALPSDMIEIHEVIVAGDILQHMDFATVKAAEGAAILWWSSASSTPQRGDPGVYYVRDQTTIGFLPVPDSGATADVYYVRFPTHMQSVSDSPAIPKQYHDILISYVVGELMEKDGRLTEASYQRKKWTEGLDQAKLELTRKIRTEVRSNPY